MANTLVRWRCAPGVQLPSARPAVTVVTGENWQLDELQDLICGAVGTLHGRHQYGHRVENRPHVVGFADRCVPVRFSGQHFYLGSYFAATVKP